MIPIKWPLARPRHADDETVTIGGLARVPPADCETDDGLVIGGFSPGIGSTRRSLRVITRVLSAFGGIVPL